MKIGLPISINMVLWGCISLLRAFIEKHFTKRQHISNREIKLLKKRVCVCVPAHNEEKTIVDTINSIASQISSKQIYIVSDGSTDKTVSIVEKRGCNVYEIKKSRGKARALNGLINKFLLTTHYDFVLFVDADTRLEKNFIDNSLIIFKNESSCAAIAGYAIPIWEQSKSLSKKDFISAYRTRLYQVLQAFLMYGQTWKYANVNPVIPGFASIYRSSVLKKINLVTPGIQIEDFNLAFQVHKKNLGFVGHYPEIKASYHDPLNFKDYIKQITRWNVGFYQTIKRQGLWPSLFWLITVLVSLEVLLYSLFILLVPLMIGIVVGWSYFKLFLYIPSYIYDISFISLEFFISVLILDYVITLFIAFVNKKPLLIIYGLFFVIFSFINSIVLLISVPKGLLTSSSGVWKHAAR